MNKLNRKIILSLLGIAFLYSTSWYYFSKQFEKHVEMQLALVQSKGFDVSFDKLSMGGFPFGYDITVKNIEVKRGDIFKTRIDGEITFSAKFWKPQEISSVVAGTHYLEFDNIKMVGKALTLKSFVFDPLRFRFAYNDFDISYNNVSVFSTKNLESAIDFTPQNPEKNLAMLKMRVDDIQSPLLVESPLGNVIQHLGFNAEIQGNFEGQTILERLTNWSNNSGALDIKEVGLEWGDLTLDGDGTISIDEELQPIAAFTFSVEGLDATVNAFVDKGYLKPEMGKLLIAGVNFFNIGKESKLSFSIQDRKLIIGSITVSEIPRIVWPTNEG